MTGSHFIVIEGIKHYTTNKTREHEGLVESARGGYSRFPKIARDYSVTTSPRLTLVKFRRGLDPPERVGFLRSV